MFERFTLRSRRVLVLAQEECTVLNHGHIGTEHILLALIREGDGIAANALRQMNISFESVRKSVVEMSEPTGHRPPGSTPFTPRAKTVLELSNREALKLGHSYIGTEHILLGLISEGEGKAIQVLRGMGQDVALIGARVMVLVQTESPEEERRARDLSSRQFSSSSATEGWNTQGAVATLYLPGPWPTLKTEMTEEFEALDVDTYGGFAVVSGVSLVDGREHPVAHNYLFKQGARGWDCLGGGGVGASEPFAMRNERAWGDKVLLLNGGGSHFARDPGGLQYVTIRCSPNVATATISRGSDLRKADVSQGPGWVAVVWTKGNEPTVTAFDFNEGQVGVLGPDELKGYLQPPFPPPPRGLRRSRR